MAKKAYLSFWSQRRSLLIIVVCVCCCESSAVKYNRVKARGH